MALEGFERRQHRHQHMPQRGLTYIYFVNLGWPSGD